MDDPLSIADVRQAEAANEKRTSEAFDSLFNLLDREFDVLLAALDLAGKSHGKELDRDYMFVYLALGSKILSNSTSAVTLLKQGHYGDTLVLLRVGISALNTLQFLAAYDEHVADWLAPQEKLSREEQKRINRVFRDANVRKKLAAKGIDSMKAAYQAISESIHASLVGMQVYAQESFSKEATHYLQVVPKFDALRAVGVAAAFIALLSMALDVLWNRYRDEIGDTDDWQAYAQLWKPLRPEALAKSAALADKVEELLQDLRSRES